MIEITLLIFVGNISNIGNIGKIYETSNFQPGNAKHVDNKPGYKEVRLLIPHPPAIIIIKITNLTPNKDYESHPHAIIKMTNFNVEPKFENILLCKS